MFRRIVLLFVVGLITLSVIHGYAEKWAVDSSFLIQDIRAWADGWLLLGQDGKSFSYQIQYWHDGSYEVWMAPDHAHAWIDSPDDDLLLLTYDAFIEDQADWTYGVWRADAQHTGWVQEWTFQIPRTMEEYPISHPCLWKDQCYYQSTRDMGRIVCMDLATEKKLWESDLGMELLGCTEDDLLFAVQRDLSTYHPSLSAMDLDERIVIRGDESAAELFGAGKQFIYEKKGDLIYRYDQSLKATGEVFRWSEMRGIASGKLLIHEAAERALLWRQGEIFEGSLQSEDATQVLSALPMGMGLRESIRHLEIQALPYSIQWSSASILQALPENVALQIQTKDTSCDLWGMYTSSAGYQALKEKGYYLNLSNEPGIADFVRQLPESIRQAVTTSEGEIVGLPVSLQLSGSNLVCFSPEVMELLGLSVQDFPSSLDALLMKLTACYQDGTLEGIRLFENADQKEMLFYFVLQNILLDGIRDEQMPSLKEYQSTFSHAEELWHAMSCYDLSNADAPYLLQQVSDVKRLYRDLHRILPITLAVEEQPQIFVDVSLVVGNPISPNKTGILSTLQAISEHFGWQERWLLCPYTSTPVVNAESLRRKEEAEAEMASLEEEMADSEAEGAGSCHSNATDGE